MDSINTSRWLMSGIAAGAVIWVLEGLGSLLYMDAIETALSAHNLSMTMSTGMMILTIILSLLVGCVLMFFYAAARPRFGPGPRTAMTVAVGMWAGSYLVSLLGYHMIGLYPVRLLGIWAVVGLAELIIAALVGGRLYQEA